MLFVRKIWRFRMKPINTINARCSSAGHHHHHHHHRQHQPSRALFGLAAVFVLLVQIVSGSWANSIADPATQQQQPQQQQHQTPETLLRIDTEDDALANASEASAAASSLPSSAAGNNSSDCPLELRGCLVCRDRHICQQCVHYITADDRQCVRECPRGYLEQWSNGPTEPFGRVCLPNVTDPMLATIVALTVGACACLMMVIFGVVMFKRKQRQKFVRSALIDDTIERDDFLKQLDDLRPNAEYFLAMLNDTRRQIRKLFLAGDHAGANSYRTIVRDLAKVLILLNRPVELIAKPPHDWPRVYSWALRIIDRYKPQIVQLIDFLQTPAAAQLNDARLGPSQYSTFKSTDTTSTTTCISPSEHSTKNMHQMQLFGSLISLHEIDHEPRASSTNPFRNSCGTLKSGHQQQQYPSSDIHGSSMWLEDEFFKLGFRPQDEITTEL